MKAVDSNVLIYAHREDSAFHAEAKPLLEQMAAGDEPWALPWVCVYQFLRVVTHPRVFRPPTPLATALATVDTLVSSPSVRLLQETERHAPILQKLFKESGATGNLVHDAHIAALLIEHGVQEILTGDGDFHRFKGFRVTNPFAPPAATP